MKHTLKVTFFLIALFLLTQIVGLAVTNSYLDHQAIEDTGNVTFKALPYSIERPQVEESYTLWYILGAVLIGTVLVLLLVKFQKRRLWKLWFALAVGLTLLMSFGAFLNQLIALILAIGLTYWKIFRPNIYVHNLTEIFIYGGLAAIFVPILNVWTVVVLLLLISIYDFIAVFKSKHMVKMAKFQSESKMFAGLLVPYKMPALFPKKAKIEKKTKKKIKEKTIKVKTAVLGGGDMGFPLLFAGVIMKGLMLTHSVWLGFLKSLIIPVFAAIGLFVLLYLAKKDKFYPAMPFITGGCLVGYGMLLLVNLIG